MRGGIRRFRGRAFPAARVGWCRPEVVHEADDPAAYYHG
jgi:hypothetical protein